ncbi:unnamed protein product [Periconia digitata]|uniref:Uncharacterized protein n=1 Tax=Periconia digitata TaxID=1303443 RepID=A0A9W4XS14_9PLEO|nr:unnamed protein product [Periconia digitata]
MAFRQQHRPQSSRQLSYHEPPPTETGQASSPQLKRPLEESEEWILFSPAAPSTTARTHTTSTERTPRTTGLSRFSDFGSLDTAARSEQDDDVGTWNGTEEGEDLDSLDDGLYAFHEPSEHTGPAAGKLQQSGDTVLPTHDGLGTFQPNANVQEHMWQFERSAPRRRQARRRSSVQRRFDALEETEELSQEQERRQRIEKWRMDQSKALIEEIERETRRRRRMSMVSGSRADSANGEVARSISQAARSRSDAHSDTSDESAEGLSFWQRLTRRVIRDLMGIDEETLAVIFGECLPEEAMSSPLDPSEIRPSIDATLRAFDEQSIPQDAWQHKLLERVARELGIIVHQLSEHPGAFSTYRLTQETPAYAGLSTTQSTSSISSDRNPTPLATSNPSITSPPSAHFAPTFPAHQSSATYSEASLWGIEEEPELIDPLSSFRNPKPPAPVNLAEEAARDQEYWEQELDVKMIFQFLVKRFSSRRPSTSSSSSPAASQSRRGPSHQQTGMDASSALNEYSSARRAAIIRQHHPLVNNSRVKENSLPTSSTATHKQRHDVSPPPVFKTHYSPPSNRRGQVLRSSSSCASQSTRKSKRSGGGSAARTGTGGRNYWDMSGSVGSGSVIASEV